MKAATRAEMGGHGSGPELVRTFLAESARAWSTSVRSIVGVVLIPGLVIAAALICALAGKEAYKWFTGEDGFAESTQVLCYALALGLAVVVTRRLRNGGQSFLAFLYAFLCVGLAFMVGEELSWGQRIFGWGTPAALETLNKQAETNFHNIHGVGHTFKWLQMVVGGYGALLPLVVFGWPALGRFRSTLSFLVPHPTLIPYFAFLFLWRIYRNFFPEPQEYYFAIAEFNEVAELVLALGFVLFLVFQLRRLAPAQREPAAA